MTGKLKPPKPRTAIFDSAAAELGGRIPGPIRVDVVDDVIWAAGGHDFSAVLRYEAGLWRSVEVPGLLNFDAVFWIDPWFCALGYDGALRVSLDGRAWKRVAVEKQVRRLGGVAAWRGGWLVGALRHVDGEQRGTLSYLGDPAAAPVLPAIPTDADAQTATFVVAERNALAWETIWRDLPGAERHADTWMKIAARRRG